MKLFNVNARAHATKANQGQRIHESEPKHENLLEFNNFRMVNVIELAQSLRSLTSL